MTKTYEEFLLGRLGDPDFCREELLGEITVVIGPPEETIASPDSEIFALADANPDLPPRALAKLIQSRTTGRSAKEIYDLLLNRMKTLEEDNPKG